VNVKLGTIFTGKRFGALNKLNREYNKEIQASYVGHTKNS